MGSDTAVVEAMRGEPVAPHHGLDLLRATGLSSGTLYPTLVRLERAGLVTSSWQDSGRRAYLLTAEGVTTIAPGAPPRGVVERCPPAGSRRRSIARWLPAAAAAWVGADAAISRPAVSRLSDLGVYMGAVRGLRHGASLYDFVSGHAPFTYPPFAGLVFLPLTFAATVPLQLAWTLATLITVVALAVLVTRAAGGRWRESAPLVAAVLLASAPVTSDLTYGQVSIALAVLVTLDVLARPGCRCQGVLIGVAAAIKLTPLIFIPMLWLAGRRRAAVVAGGTFACCGALGAALLPGDSWRFWSTEMWNVNRLGFVTSVGNQSFDGALMRAGVADPVRSLALLLVAGAVAGLALRRAAHAGRAGDPLSATILAGAASVVVSPVSWTHHQVWLVLAALLPVAGPPRVRLAWVAVVLGVTVLPVTALGPPLWSNARLLLAVAAACLVPLRAPDQAGDVPGRRGTTRHPPPTSQDPPTKIRASGTPVLSWTPTDDRGVPPRGS